MHWFLWLLYNCGPSSCQRWATSESLEEFPGLGKLPWVLILFTGADTATIELSNSLLHRNPKRIFGPKARQKIKGIWKENYILIDLCLCSIVVLLFFLSLCHSWCFFFYFSISSLGHVSSFLLPEHLFQCFFSHNYIINLCCIVSLFSFSFYVDLLCHHAYHCCSCYLISVLTYTSATLECTGLVQCGQSVFSFSCHAIPLSGSQRSQQRGYIQGKEEQSWSMWIFWFLWGCAAQLLSIKSVWHHSDPNLRE